MLIYVIVTTGLGAMGGLCGLFYVLEQLVVREWV